MEKCLVVNVFDPIYSPTNESGFKQGELFLKLYVEKEEFASSRMLKFKSDDLGNISFQIAQ
jgi:hypothetical protein